MNKEEFGSIVSSELERYRKREEKLKNQLPYYKGIFASTAEKRLEFELSVVRKKIYRLEEIIDAEIFARIQVMSSVEAEEYKKEKEADLQRELKRLEHQKDDIGIKIYKLEHEIYEYSITPNSADDPELLSRGVKLRVEINNLEREANSISNEIEKVKKEIEKLKTKTLQDIKEDLMKKLKDKKRVDIDEEIKDSQEYISPKLQDDDVEKAEEIAMLRRHYFKEYSTKEKEDKYAYCEEKYYDLSGLSYSFAHDVAKVFNLGLFYSSYDAERVDVRCVRVKNPDVLLDYFDDYGAKLAEAKKKFGEIYKLENLLPIVKMSNGELTDYTFLGRFVKLGVISEQKINELNRLVSDRESLSIDHKKRIIKFGKKFNQEEQEIEVCNRCINELLAEIKERIIYWYDQQFNFRYFGVGTIYYDSEEKLAASIAKIERNFELFEESLNTLREQARGQQQIVIDRRQKFNLEKQKILDKLAELTGRKTKLVKGTTEYVEDVASEISYGYESEVLQRVKAGAQLDADKKEAELRKMSLEQLYEMRKKYASQQSDNSESSEKKI